MRPLRRCKRFWWSWGMSDVHYAPLSSVLLPPISGSRPAGGVSSDTEGVPSIGGENIVVSGGMTYDELKRMAASKMAREASL